MDSGFIYSKPEKRFLIQILNVVFHSFLLFFDHSLLMIFQTSKVLQHASSVHFTLKIYLKWLKLGGKKEISQLIGASQKLKNQASWV